MNALLSLLEPSEQKALAAVAHLQRFAKGQTIYEEGKPAADIWVVASGQVKIVKFSEGGQALALELMIAPELFGAVFYAQDPVYPCSAIAWQETAVLRFRVADLFSCSKRKFTTARRDAGGNVPPVLPRAEYARFGDGEGQQARRVCDRLPSPEIRLRDPAEPRDTRRTCRGHRGNGDSSIEVLSLAMLEEFAFGIPAKNRPAIVARRKS